MGLDKFLNKKSKIGNSAKNKQSYTEKKQSSMENIDLSLKQGEDNSLERNKQTLNFNVEALGERELEVNQINRNQLILFLEKKLSSLDKKDFIEAIIDMIQSNPLYVTHKNLIGSLLELEQESPDFEKFTIPEIAFELNLNEMYVEILLAEIQLFWK